MIAVFVTCVTQTPAGKGLTESGIMSPIWLDSNHSATQRSKEDLDFLIGVSFESL